MNVGITSCKPINFTQKALSMFSTRKWAAAAAVALAVGGGASIAATTAHASTVPAPIASAAPGSTFTAGNLIGIHTKPLALNNGSCMYVPNAAAGTPVREGHCDTANQWDYFSNGQLSPAGHDNVAVADSGGIPTLRAEPTTVVDSDDVRNTVNGSYFELLMTPRIGVNTHIYIHSGTSGNILGTDNQGGNGGNYWRLQAD